MTSLLDTSVQPHVQWGEKLFLSNSLQVQNVLLIELIWVTSWFLDQSLWPEKRVYADSPRPESYNHLDEGMESFAKTRRPREWEGRFHEQEVGSGTGRKEGRDHTGKHHKDLPRLLCAEVPAHRVTRPPPQGPPAHLPPHPDCPSIHLPSSLTWVGLEPSHLSGHFLLKAISFVFGFKVCCPEWNTVALRSMSDNHVSPLGHSTSVNEVQEQKNELVLVDIKLCLLTRNTVLFIWHLELLSQVPVQSYIFSFHSCVVKFLNNMAHNMTIIYIYRERERKRERERLYIGTHPALTWYILYDSHAYKITYVRKITGPESWVQALSTNTYKLCDLCWSLNYSVYTSSYRYELKISTLHKSYISKSIITYAFKTICICVYTV